MISTIGTGRNTGRQISAKSPIQRTLQVALCLKTTGGETERKKEEKSSVQSLARVNRRWGHGGQFSRGSVSVCLAGGHGEWFRQQ